MVYLPQDVFKRILSFKDPRYERVMNGPPYMATPTHVFNILPTRGNFWIYDRDIERNFDMVNNLYYERKPIFMYINRYIPGILNRTALLVCDGKPLMFLMSDAAQDLEKRDTRLAEMSLQCEPCRTDLELYQRRR